MPDPITPFRIEVPDAELDDLRDRLRRTRWPEREPVEDWSQGVPLGYLQQLCAYWADEYDWRTTEARLNALPQFRIEIDGLGIHFLHARSPHADALPLVLDPRLARIDRGVPGGDRAARRSAGARRRR
jgi:hypothetical protein